MPRGVTDIWRCGIVHAPMTDIVKAGSVQGMRIDWLPVGPSFTFIADPFGIWRDGILHMFVETLDYRVGIGAIDVLRFDADFNYIDRAPCLREPWHLSYPRIIEDGGETYMLPEANESGTLTLYRAADFPTRWEPVARFALDTAAIDPSPIFYEGRWWMFYSPAGPRINTVGTLHIAYADKLTGPWTCHPGNPVQIDISRSRPGGTPIITDGKIHAPMQDCSRTYGGAIRILRIDTLTPDNFAATASEPIMPTPDFAPFIQGLHTLAACGDVTFIDAKLWTRSPFRLGIELGRYLRKRFGGG